jgi:hypothetical protein
MDGGNILLWTIGGILTALWLLGFIGHFGGWSIHLLLVIAVMVFVASFVTRRWLI